MIAALAGCGEPVQDDHFANSIEIERPDPAPVRVDSVPVRIGELGASFGACSAAGTTRHLAERASLPVRSAPFEAAERLRSAGVKAARRRDLIDQVAAEVILRSYLDHLP